MATVDVTAANFEQEVLHSDRPVLIDFWATWCGPCKTIAPLVEEVSTEMSEQIKVVKVNIDDARDLAVKHGIRGVPTLQLVKEGQVLATKVGALQKSQLENWIKETV